MSYYKHRDTAWNGISTYLFYKTDISDKVDVVIERYLKEKGIKKEKDDNKNAQNIQKRFNDFKDWLKTY